MIEQGVMGLLNFIDIQRFNFLRKYLAANINFFLHFLLLSCRSNTHIISWYFGLYHLQRVIVQPVIDRQRQKLSAISIFSKWAIEFLKLQVCILPQIPYLLINSTVKYSAIQVLAIRSCVHSLQYLNLLLYRVSEFI